LAEEKRWYITYTAYSPNGAAVALACFNDLVHAERIGLLFSPNNKDTVLFPQKFSDRWTVLHRPDAGGMEHIWSAYSPDLVPWGEPHCVLPERKKLRPLMGTWSTVWKNNAKLNSNCHT